MIRIIFIASLVTTIFISGCVSSSSRSVRFCDIQKYQPPTKSPYTHAEEIKQYLRGFKSGWLNVARYSIIYYAGNSVVKVGIHKKYENLEWIKWGPYQDGWRDGNYYAENQVHLFIESKVDEMVRAAEPPPPN